MVQYLDHPVGLGNKLNYDTIVGFVYGLAPTLDFRTKIVRNSYSSLRGPMQDHNNTVLVRAGILVRFSRRTRIVIKSYV